MDQPRPFAGSPRRQRASAQRSCALISALALLLALSCRAQSGAGSAAPEQERGSCTLRVHADGLRNAKGVVGVLLFRTAQGWPEDVGKSFRHEADGIAFHARATTVTVNGLPAGDYAVVALHDENRNMKLDRNVLGWPKEGFGFSNNSRVGFGPPSFRQSLVHVACPATEITVQIVYK